MLGSQRLIIELQSRFRSGHSIASVLLRIQYDIPLILNNRKFVVLILLGFSLNTKHFTKHLAEVNTILLTISKTQSVNDKISSRILIQ